ncbi:PEP-CTERM sorting domain-containing protein [Botrimarina hoheduenensis]|uniref:Ice-binding protein C-terminal domain-containing protein n=1 Tax=Botrimarina hoheduenensis TaxID=2528000 RepID=A0A5C5VXS1_9BACT|nr:PEP-CTERM sorting domain-containing protein [Botrimarina hoheduenensis]TWT43416.1 hypothetical protein Pla111_23670 [Botrimarina hoheduenensis]
MMCKRFLAFAMIGSLAVSSASAQILYTEDFDDLAGATRWSTIQTTEFTTPDSTIDYAFDYSQIVDPFVGGGTPIPPAPNGDGISTIGVFMTANNTDNTTGDEGDGIGAVSSYALPSGNFKVAADMYLFWNGGGGSTEYGGIGVHHDGSQNVPLRFGVNEGSGIAWTGTTDGDTAGDLISFNSSTGQAVIANFQDWPANVPVPPGTTIGQPVPGGLFGAWSTLEIAVANGNATLFINGVKVHTVANPFSGGGVLLTHNDIFNSVNQVIVPGGFTNGSVFDNIVVSTIPEPATGLLVLVGLAGFAARRR